MQVTVFGASGQVGRLVVGELQASGHEVVVFVHRSNPFRDTAGIRVVEGSVTDGVAVRRAVDGSGAVISTLGSWGSPNKNVVSSGSDVIIQAMTSLEVNRLITLTGASAMYSLDKPGVLAKLTRQILGLMAPKILVDGEKHLASLEKSRLKWTCVRSPVMTTTSSKKYHLSDKLPSIIAVAPRQAVAKCLVDQLTDTNFIRKAPVIYRG